MTAADIIGLIRAEVDEEAEAYREHRFGDDTPGNAQLWSLWQALRAERVDELAQEGRL